MCSYELEWPITCLYELEWPITCLYELELLSQSPPQQLLVDQDEGNSKLLILELPFRSQLINFIKKYFKELVYIY